jgi:hypothetical protein
VFGREVLLVHRVPGLVEHAEERLVEELGVVPGGDAAVARAEPGAERVRGGVQPAAAEVEPDRDRRGLGEHLLPLDRELALQHPLVRLLRGRDDRPDERRQLGGKVGEQRLQVGDRGARLVLLDERVVPVVLL